MPCHYVVLSYNKGKGMVYGFDMDRDIDKCSAHLDGIMCTQKTAYTSHDFILKVG